MVPHGIFALGGRTDDRMEDIVDVLKIQYNKLNSITSEKKVDIHYRIQNMSVIQIFSIFSIFIDEHEIKEFVHFCHRLIWWYSYWTTEHFSQKFETSFCRDMNYLPWHWFNVNLVFTLSILLCVNWKLQIVANNISNHYFNWQTLSVILHRRSTTERK